MPILCEKVREHHLGAKTGEGILVWDEERVQACNENLVSSLIKIAAALDRL